MDQQTVTPKPDAPNEQLLEAAAANIVHQIGDALHEALPPDMAHNHFVTARQATNDRAIAFVKQVITAYTADTRHHDAPTLGRAQLVGLIEHELERVWDDGNATGLDGWTGPGRGAGEVDAYAIQQRHRDTRSALDRIIGRLYPPDHQPQRGG